MKQTWIFLLLLAVLLMSGCTETPAAAAAPTEPAPSASIQAGIETTAQSSPASETEASTASSQTPFENPSDTSAAQILDQIVEKVTTPPPEPLEITLTVPEAVTVTADAPTVNLPCSLTRTGDGPETGQFQVYQNGQLIWDVALTLQTGEGPVQLTYEFTRYMTQTSDTVYYVLTYGDETLTAQTEVTLVNWPDEVYAKASGEKLPYSIEVVKNHNVVLIYGMDENREYTQLVKTFLCSTGQWTPLGNFTASTRYEGWRTLYANAAHTAYCYGQYAIVISGDYLFHSVPYYTPNKNDLEYTEFNKLGTQASLGCIRLAVADVKWIYDNCPYGTPVSIVNREELGVEKPEALYIDPESPNRGWDPTDPDPANPWLADAG